MKIARLILPFALAASLHAEVPVELEKLNQSYAKALEKATAPLRQTYLDELRKLQASYTKAGNLDAAIEVRAVLADLEASSTSGGTDANRKTSPPVQAAAVQRNTTPPDGPLPFVSPKRWIEKTETNTFTYTFSSDGSGSQITGAGNLTPFTWEVVGTEVVATLKGLNTKRHFVFERPRQGTLWLASKPEEQIALIEDR